MNWSVAAQPRRWLLCALALAWEQQPLLNGCDRARKIMNLHNFSFSIDQDQIATLIWDMKDRSMNVITPEVMNELERVVAKVSDDPAIKGCVITSGKATFSGG